MLGEQGTISLKMDLQVPRGSSDSPRGSADDPDWGWEPEGSPWPSDQAQAEVFFVALHARLGVANASSGSVILETLDRITPYSGFSACADRAVKLQLCVCDLTANATRGSGDLAGARLPTAEELSERGPFLGVRPEVFVAEGSRGCLALVVRRNAHGGVFSAANVCGGRAFRVLFRLETQAMLVSDPMPREETLFPGQELLLAMAVRAAPKAEWTWSFTLHHTQQDL